MYSSDSDDDKEDDSSLSSSDDEAVDQESDDHRRKKALRLFKIPKRDKSVPWSAAEIEILKRTGLISEISLTL